MDYCRISVDGGLYKPRGPEVGYPMLMLECMPVGLLEIIMTSFLAAFMSTIDTHLN